jgi:hypothetical protein
MDTEKLEIQSWGIHMSPPGHSLFQMGCFRHGAYRVTEKKLFFMRRKKGNAPYPLILKGNGKDFFKKSLTSPPL